MKYTKDIIAILVILFTGVGLFIPVVDETSNQILRALSSLIVGFYFGVNKELVLTTLFGLRNKNK